MTKHYKKILIANRGEIAVRIIRACKEIGIQTISVYSKEDKEALHTRLADYKICIGNGQNKDSYLNSYHILSAATYLKADAIHPGIGFFAESTDFAQMCKLSGIDFIGANNNALQIMGNKILAKQAAKECKVPIIGDDSVEVKTVEDCLTYIAENGLPVILKSAEGGGGKGIRVIYSIDDLEKSLTNCKKEAEASFHKNSILIEKFYEGAKHVEVQVLGDKYGNVIHLGDRECSIQRYNQKIIEETRCTNISEELRNKIYEESIKICKKINYEGPGTIEFLVLQDGSYFFMEMNTRLQVEHTITEMLTGIDLVKEQIRIAEGNQLKYEQQDIHFQGFALQCRILAEYLNDNGKLLPSYGRIKSWHMPGGFGIRVDTGYEIYNSVTPYYDSLLAKICCHGNSKEEAVNKMLSCLEEIRIDGISTNVNMLQLILKDYNFTHGSYDTNYVKTLFPSL